MTIVRAFKRNVIVITAWVLAIVSILFIPVDKEYFKYIDYKTILCLFSMMLVIEAYRDMSVFTVIAKSLIRRLKNTRLLVLYLISITYISSMFIANDIALLTFLPLTIAVFKQCGKEIHIARTIILQNIAANLGGMIMPFGNPQSLYLFSYYNMDIHTYVKIMLIPFLVSFMLIMLLSVLTDKEDVALIINDFIKVSRPKSIIYAVCFIIVVLAVFNIINFFLASIIVTVIVIISDRVAIKKVNYGLLFTFIAFFIFASNMARIEAVGKFVTMVIEKNTLLVGIISCQFFSNVPTAIFLSRFTLDYPALLLAVNIGGTGTIVASLASIISFTIYYSMYPGSAYRYLIKFSAYNFIFLLLLIMVSILTINYIL